MVYDFYAELFLKDGKEIKNKIVEFKDKAAKREKWMEQNLPRFFRAELIAKNWYTIIKELSLFEKYYEGSDDVKKDDVKAGYKGFIQTIKVYPIDDSENLENCEIFKEIKEPKINVGVLPGHSILIKVIFSLKKPYISRDDDDFYIVDNPVCKDKVFKVPLVRPSSWKGALRYAAMEIILRKPSEGKINARLALVRLFGNEKDKTEKFLDDQLGDESKSKYKQKVKEIYGEEPNLRGRLVFYPTFFDKIGLDVIAPHDRKTKTPARGPIYFETVPEGAEGRGGTFSVLYFPFDLIGESEERVKKELKEDLEILKEAIPAMFTKYGFGAKTTAGYGVILSKVKFQILPEMKEMTKDDYFGEEGSTFVGEMDGLMKSYGEECEQRRN